MGSRSGLPDMYAQVQGHEASDGECRHARQIMTAYVTHVTYVCNISGMLKIAQTSTGHLHISHSRDSTLSMVTGSH